MNATEDKDGNLILADGTMIPAVERTRCEIYSRVCGYLRPVEAWNPGKQEEFGDRKAFKVQTDGKVESKVVAS